jgi:hypothetical protein
MNKKTKRVRHLRAEILELCRCKGLSDEDVRRIVTEWAKEEEEKRQQTVFRTGAAEQKEEGGDG